MGDRRTRRVHIRRVLGLGRGARHKVLPAVVLLVAFAPALVSVAFAALLKDIESDQLITYGEYTFIIGSALALFAALIAPEALCPDRRSGMLALYLAGPLDRNRYLLAKGSAVYLVMLAMSLGPLLFMYLAFVVAGFGPSASETPKLLLQILASGLATGIAYAALSLATASFTTRRAVAAVAVMLLLLVPDIAVRAAIESGAPDALSLLGMPAVVYELSYRIFGEAKPGDTPITRVSTELVLAGFFMWTGLSAAVCWLRYRRIEAFDECSAPRRCRGRFEVVRFTRRRVRRQLRDRCGRNRAARAERAGKSTMLRMLCGLARPSRGTVRVLGRNPAADVEVAGSIGLVPQQETVFEPLTANRFVQLTAKLHGLPDPEAVAMSALESVGLDPADTRRLPAYSKGMRQRVKVAQALVHDPPVVILDEPLTGLDPRQRLDTIRLFQRLGAEGRCVLVSSHVLDEVERLGSSILMMSQGRLSAAGDFHELRAMMDDRPLRVRVRTDRPRELAAALLETGAAVGARLDGDEGLEIDTNDARGLARALAPPPASGRRASSRSCRSTPT